MRIVLVYVDVHKTYLFGFTFTRDLHVHKTTDLSLGLASIKTYSRQDPYIRKNCQFINRVYADSLSNEAMAEDILSQKPDLVGFSVNVWNFEETKNVRKIIKDRNSNIKVILGGPMVPDDVESNKKMLASDLSIDALIRGEGEIAFRQLLRFYLKKEDISNIPNAALRKGGEIFINTTTASLKDLSKLPSPYLSGDVRIYDNATGVLALETSRGCINNCAYCHYHGGERPKFFNIKKIKQELELFKSKGFNGQIYVVDPLLNFNKGWFKRVITIMGDFDFKISLELRLELIDDEMIELLTKIYKLDCSVGLQSINPVALKDVTRSTDIEKCRKVILKMVKSRIDTGIGLILGLPGDNYETFKKTIDWVVYCKVPRVNISDLVLIPNSGLEKAAQKFKIKCNKQNIVLSNYTFSEEDMVKASHFRGAFHFLYTHHKNIFNISKYGFRFKPSAVIEKFVTAAKKNKEMPSGRLLDLCGIDFSDQTIVYFLRSLFDDKETIKYFFKLFKRSSRHS
ncbi:MAG: radical SAM protein [Candidatus Omnitrophica bacterium]|nr:radical SAM protein [Candidatus Omnitrophota bacterium]